MHFLKLFLTFLIGILFYTTTVTPLQAYNSNAAYFQGEDFSQNLDLDAVASLFGQSKDLSDFEWRLNDPYNQISNLDLNNDNRVDYLRIIERAQGNMRLIIIQAVIGPDLYQDIAMIEIYRDRHNKTSIQIIGDSYIYGDNYIINPSYLYAPVIYSYFWGSRYHNPYYSRYRWGAYPRHYRAWRPRSTHYYNQHVYRYIDRRNHYNRSRIRKTHHAREIYRGVRRNDYARKHPNRSYNKMQQRTNRSKTHGMNNTRSSRQTNQAINPKRSKQTTNRQHLSKQRQHTRQSSKQHIREQKATHRQSYRKNPTHSSKQQRNTHKIQTRGSKQKAQTAQRHRARQTIQKQSLQQKREPGKTRTQRQTHSTQQTKTRNRTQRNHSNSRERQ